MDYKDKVIQLFSYLLNVKNLNEKIIRTVWDYEKIYWEEDLCKTIGCNINKGEDKDWWLEISKKCKSIYEQFFKLFLEFQKKGESVEIVWGHGLIAWNFNNEKIMHPVLTTRMKLDFNANSNIFSLIPDNKTIMEANIFDGIDIPNSYSILDIERKLKDINFDPRNMNEIEDILTEIVSYLSPNGRFEKLRVPIDKIALSSDPVIYNIPVILIRKNNMRLWQLELNNIINEVNNGQPIPETINSLVNDEKIEQSKEDLKEWSEVHKDVLFPLPSNSEQREVVKRICENYGVVVQGPPGTGKSHTIANLICHLLAHGKRVLVTSQTDRALKVLADKIPEQVQPLCMSVLGNDIASLKKLNESVKKISDNLSVNPKNLYEEIQDLKLELDKCKKSQELLYDQFKEIQHIENEAINYNNEKYKIVDIAAWVKRNKEKCSWIEDKVSFEKKMPISEVEFERLTFLLSRIGKDEKNNFDTLKVMVDKLPKSKEICQKIIRFKEISNEYENCIKYIKDWRIPDKDRCNYDRLLQLLAQCKNSICELENSIFSNIFTKYYESKIVHDSMIDLWHKSNDYMLVLGKIRNELRNHSVELPDKVDIDKLNKDFDILYENINSKKKVGKLFRIIHPEFNYIINECIVDYKPLETLDQAFILKLYIQEKLIVRELTTLWNNTIKEYESEVSEDDKNNLKMIKIEQHIKHLNSIVQWDKNYKKEVIAALGKISISINIDWYKKETYDYLIEGVKCIKKIDEYNNLKAYIDVLKKLILATGKLEQLYDAVEEMNLVKINDALKEIDNFKIIKSKFIELDNLIGKLEEACPNTAQKILNQWENAGLLFKNWDSAWKWAEWSSLLKDVHKLNIDSIEEAISEEKRRERMLIKELVAKRTWYNQILKTTESEKRSLFAWMQAVKRIGKGTGKMASNYRRIAQDEMEKCKRIIPVWIMPLNRVVENIKLSRDLFDVIIFDESSQSDIFSICALMRAKKAIIVGDDKQISPEVVGIDQGFIQGLINKHLRDIPQNEWFDLQTSLYDTALRVFPNRLMLKEHFRCVPEIIKFSNDNCYAGDMKPLRYLKSYEAFYPPVVPVEIDNGYREQGKPINIPEAEFIANKVAECCRDRRYAGMTMGAISLLGESQGELIESMIREKIGEEEMIKRKLICGDAYSFQGDERDIMFLSMVISNNVKFTALTKESDVRRFNVAASRARNQMWLIYSIDLEELNPECIRYSLLNYCLNYDKVNCHNTNINYAFQTRFQKDVYNMIIDKGIELAPQVKIGRYKIDFVVEGSTNKIAIICEGEMLNENYDWEERLEVQMELERIGWTFLRIRPSEFYYNPEKTMDKLWQKLKNNDMEQYKNKNLIAEQLKVV